MDGKPRDRSPVWITPLVGVIGVVVGAAITGGLSYIGQQHEIDAKMIELTVGILRAVPTHETNPLREWAVDEIEKRGKFKFTFEQRTALVDFGIPPEEILEENLTSSNTLTRRRTRTVVGKMGQNAIPLITFVLEKNRDKNAAKDKAAHYRLVFGAIEALKEMNQDARCTAYKDNPQLKDDVEKQGGIDEKSDGGSLNDAAKMALNCRSE